MLSSVRALRLRNCLRSPPLQNTLPRYCRVRSYVDAPSAGSPLSANDGIRMNEIGIQQLPKFVHDQIFSDEPTPPPPELVNLSKKHLERHELLGKNTEVSKQLSFDLPKLQGKSLDEHFYNLGSDASEPHLTYAREFAEKDLPKIPKEWSDKPGWTKYNADGTQEQVSAPDEKMMTFDVEVLYKISPFAVMACAASLKAWYSWLSPWLFDESDNPKSDRHLVPLGDPNKARIIVGHNIGYDRARVAEEYNIKQTKNAFIDTMSLHVAVNGMCSRQRPTWMKHRKDQELRDKFVAESNTDALVDLLQSPGFEEPEEPWIEKSSINSLLDVAKFHCNLDIDKSVRDQFGVLDKKGVLLNCNELLAYCAADVAITHQVYKKVFPGFLKICPHPVSFAALRHLSSVTLPVNRSWERYIDQAETTYMDLSGAVQKSLLALTEEARILKTKKEVYEKDEWLQQLDWSGQEIRYLKLKKGETEKDRKMARQKKPGEPKWYKDLFPKSSALEPTVTVRSRIAPLLLRMTWDGRPLVWSDKYGWTCRVPKVDAGIYKDTPMVKVNMSMEKNPRLQDDLDHDYFKLPHKDGPAARCVNPLAKGYLQHFESTRLSSEYKLAKKALEMNAACSYWISARARIKSQMVVYQSDLDTNLGLERKVKREEDVITDTKEDVKSRGKIDKKAKITSVKKQKKVEAADAKPGVESTKGQEDKVDAGSGLTNMEKEVEAIAAKLEVRELEKGENLKAVMAKMKEEDESDVGIILPQLVPMGTITRRGVERTWLTASNAKKNRVGSELKAMVKAPPGYIFVGADVDSQELWIASLMGDAQFKLHGGNALGFMTLEGTKAAGTDLHSKTAKILGISRNNAKVFNYGRIYGAGLKFATTLLRQFNPGISDGQAVEIAENLYIETKGQKVKVIRTKLSPRRFWRGGTESFVFNRLEEFADQEHPETPVLGAGITEALQRNNLGKSTFMTSRINWAIQSSGVDYLHLLIISMDYLIRRFKLDARLAITVHDEIRYLVKMGDRYRAAMALQVANLWTRAMFSQQMGINDLPQSCAYFSAVDIDPVLRKEVDMDCITPSQPFKIEPGESLDMAQLLEMKEAKLDLKNFDTEPWIPNPAYQRRTPVMEQIRTKASTAYLAAQITSDERELKEIIQRLDGNTAVPQPPPPKTKSPPPPKRLVMGRKYAHNDSEAQKIRAYWNDVDAAVKKAERLPPPPSSPQFVGGGHQTTNKQPSRVYGAH